MPPTIGKRKMAFPVGPTAFPVASTSTPASERAAAVPPSSSSRVFPPFTGVVAASRSVAWAGVADSARATSASAKALASVSSAAALTLARSGEPNALFGRVFMAVWASSSLVAVARGY